MRRNLLIGALAAAAVLTAFAAPAAARTLRWASQGDILTFDPMAQNESSEQHLRRLRLRRPRPLQQAVRARARAGGELDAARTDALALRPAQGRPVPRRLAADRRRRRVLVRARAEALVEHEDLRPGREGGEEDRREHDRHHHRRPEPGAAARPGRRQDHEQGVVDEEQLGQPAELRAEGGELRRPQHQRHRPVHAEVARSRREDRAGRATRTGGTRPRATSPRSSTRRSSPTRRGSRR